MQETIGSFGNITYSNQPDPVKLGWQSIGGLQSEGGRFDSYRGQEYFSACLVWIYTQSITTTSFSHEYLTPESLKIMITFI